MEKKSGFTLIELLVVIAIISILAAILFPVFATAREKARQSACSNNEKQMGLALMQYAEDYDETYPLVYWSSTANHWIPNIGSNGVSSDYMETAIYPYVKSTGIYVCPSQPTNLTYFTGAFWITNPGATVSYPTDYVENLLILSRQDMSTPTPVLLSNLDVPSTTYAIVEVNPTMSSSGSMTVSPGVTGQWSRPPSTNDIHEGAPHSGGMNIIFCDGHVKWVSSQFYESTAAASSYWDPAYTN